MPILDNATTSTDYRWRTIHLDLIRDDNDSNDPFFIDITTNLTTTRHYLLRFNQDKFEELFYHLYNEAVDVAIPAIKDNYTIESTPALLKRLNLVIEAEYANIYDMKQLFDADEDFKKGLPAYKITEASLPKYQDITTETPTQAWTIKNKTNEHTTYHINLGSPVDNFIRGGNNLGNDAEFLEKKIKASIYKAVVGAGTRKVPLVPESIKYYFTLTYKKHKYPLAIVIKNPQLLLTKHCSDPPEDSTFNIINKKISDNTTLHDLIVSSNINVLIDSIIKTEPEDLNISGAGQLIPSYSTQLFQKYNDINENIINYIDAVEDTSVLPSIGVQDQKSFILNISQTISKNIDNSIKEYREQNISEDYHRIVGFSNDGISGSVIEVNCLNTIIDDAETYIANKIY